MSVSKQQLQDFAQIIKGHPAYDEVMMRIQKALFDRWLKANDEERKIIGDISHNQGLFTDEINRIVDSIDESKPINTDEGESDG